jgi:hypothetical protein
MTREEAIANIGQPFKWKYGGNGVLGRFDVIGKVGDDGYICGHFIQAHHNDCRLKQEQPEHLKKQHHEENINH